MDIRVHVETNTRLRSLKIPVLQFQTFDLNVHNNIPVMVVLNDVIIARWFRLVVTAERTYAQLTMELYGRPHGNSV